MARAPKIVLFESERLELESLLKSGDTPQRLVPRLRIVLLAAEGKHNTAISVALSISRDRVARWRSRFAAHGLAGIERDKKRPGRLPRIASAKTAEVLEATLHEKPPGAARRWTLRSMAKRAKVSKNTVRAIWKAHNLEPHKLKQFRPSTDPQFVEKLRDVVGLYLNPPQNAVVFSADEKSQCQALERTWQRKLDFGRPAAQSHDYTRHGTLTLFAALEIVTGRLVHMTHSRHRHREWLRFLDRIDQSVAEGLEIHVICDNYAAHKTAEVKKWLEKRKRIHLHFTPTHASWLNLVERYFAKLTTSALTGQSFKSLAALRHTLEQACEYQNTDGKPFVWKATAESILAKLHCLNPSGTGH
jgi:transposase